VEFSVVAQIAEKGFCLARLHVGERESVGQGDQNADDGESLDGHLYAVVSASYAHRDFLPACGSA
jgi:hypothetical protein